ncbi:MAG: PLP-dependent transferase, partial [Calditrichota bacterium]
MRSYYGVRHCLPANSLETAFFEVLEYFLDDGSITSVYVISDSNGVGAIRWNEAFREYPQLGITLFPEDEWPSLEVTDVSRQDLWIVAVREPEAFLKNHQDFVEKIRQKRGRFFLLSEQIQKELPKLQGAQFYMTGLNEPRSPVTGAVILSNADRQMMGLRNRLKRRGPVLSGRNAGCFLSSESDSQADQLVTTRLAVRISELEHGSHTFLYPSGMNAIASVLDLIHTSKRPQVISVGHLYSDTYTTLRDSVVTEGIPGNIFLGVDELDRLPEAITEHTGAIITESITNPLNDVPDLDYIAGIARRHNIAFIVDNTIATSRNCHPLHHGADIVIHSTTKFLSGKNNHGGGAVTLQDATLAERLAAQQVRRRNEMSPLEAVALWDNLQDFEERMERFNRNAIAVAEFLEHHP